MQEKFEWIHYIAKSVFSQNIQLNVYSHTYKNTYTHNYKKPHI